MFEMRLRWLVGILMLQILCHDAASAGSRPRRQASVIYQNHPREAKAYQPPLPLGAPTIPVASSATIQNSYQPPISLIRSNEYQSPLNIQQNTPRGYQSLQLSASQGYVLPNQPPPPSYSVQYTPPANPQRSFSVNQQSSGIPQSLVPPVATSYSVHQQPDPKSHGQSFAILSDASGLPQSTAERTYSTHSKVVESSHVPAQAIHKAPASEIQSDKGHLAKEKDSAKDEYVVYYYYYYDNDTSANNNLSLNFDDIPSLEAYDADKAKEPEKSASARTIAANVNSLAPIDPKKDTSDSISSQPRSAPNMDREPYIRADRSNSPLEDTVVQPLKPISNVFRYGSNEVPRFPVLPNFIVTEVPTTEKPGVFTPDTLTSESPTTQQVQLNSQLPDFNSDGEPEDDDVNNVLDNATDLKSIDDKANEEDSQTTTTTTTTEATTTTEIPTTTTTEKPRRRPPIGGGRRRFNSSPASSFSSNRNRQTPTRGSTSSTTTTTTTTTSPPTRRTFQGNRLRPRPAIGSNRPRIGSRTTESTEEKVENRTTESTTASTASSRSRFTSAAPRRFQSSRSRSQAVSSTTSTTRSPTSVAPSRSRPTSRPRPNPITRNRPPRPGFLRPRPGSEPEVPETTTTSPEPTEQETSPSGTNEEQPSTNEENDTEEDNETSSEETEEPTTTEGNRFSALFRPRNRNALGNRPRPVIGNRPSRS